MTYPKDEKNIQVIKENYPIFLKINIVVYCLMTLYVLFLIAPFLRDDLTLHTLILGPEGSLPFVQSPLLIIVLLGGIYLFYKKNIWALRILIGFYIVAVGFTSIFILFLITLTSIFNPFAILLMGFLIFYLFSIIYALKLNSSRYFES